MSHYTEGQLFAERIQLLACLHESHSSELWLAHDSLGNDDNIVVKIFAFQRPLTPREQAEFNVYYARLVMLAHPGLLAPLHFDIFQGTPYLLLPYHEQRSLRDRMQATNAPPCSEEEMLRLLANISGALAYLHEQIPPVLHRELAPDNILVCADGHYQLADYGRSDAVRRILLHGTPRMQEFNPDYSPPEYFRSTPAFLPQGDIYALGALVVEIVLGSRPAFSTRTPEGMTALLAARPAHISQASWEVLCRCLDPDLDVRPSADELAKWAIWRRHVIASEPAVGSPAYAQARARGWRARLLPGGVVAALLIVSACFLLNPAGKGGHHRAKASSNVEVILRLHGSNTIGSELAPELAKAFFHGMGATGIVRVPGAMDEMQVQAQVPGSPTTEAIEIFAHGSATAFTDMTTRSCDIGNASRRIKDDEARQLAPLGDMSAPACEHVLAMDGIAVIVPKNNTLTQLAKKQLADIFSGKITNWRQLGGADLPIKVYARDDKSGTWDTFKSLVLGTDHPLIASAKRYEDSDQLRQAISSDPQGIGFVSLAYTKDVKVLAISDGSQAIPPTIFTIGTEDYPLARRLFFYTAAAPTNKYVRDFIEFALSDAGQDICSRVGFVGQKVLTMKHDARLVQLNFSFRFLSGHAALDSKAVRDLDRLVAFLHQPDSAKRLLCLYGYSDNVGDQHKNVALSLERAQSVAHALKSHGITAGDVEGFGAQNPVASNENNDGRFRNRRVEVWLK